MRWLALLWLAALPALAGETKIAVAPIDGLLGRADAAALEEAVRTEARGLDLSVAPGAPASIEAAAESGATYVITGKAVRLEGALAVILTLVRTEDGEKKGMERLVGYALADLKGEAKKKVPRLLRAGLGMAAPAATATPTATAKATATPTAKTTATATASVAPPSVVTRTKPGPKFVRPPTQITGAEESSPLVKTIREVVEDVEDVRGL